MSTLPDEHLKVKKIMRTIKDIAAEALYIQDAVNLSAVVHAFERAITDVKQIMREQGKTLSTMQICEHPIFILYASKISSLTYCDNPSVFSKAYNCVKDLT